MKKIILSSVMAIAAVSSLSAQAAVATFCAAGAAQNSTVTATIGSTMFVKVAFTPKCSANVFLSGDDNSATIYRVGSASAKGRNSYNGSTVGGSVTTFTACAAATGCVAADVATAIAAAPTT